MDYMIEPPEPPEDRDPPRFRDDDGPLDDWSDEAADAAEDKWIAERDNLYR